MSDSVNQNLCFGFRKDRSVIADPDAKAGTSSQRYDITFASFGIALDLHSDPGRFRKRAELLMRRLCKSKVFHEKYREK
nr:hypothetical protein [Nisaea sp.]